MKNDLRISQLIAARKERWCRGCRWKTAYACILPRCLGKIEWLMQRAKVGGSVEPKENKCGVHDGQQGPV